MLFAGSQILRVERSQNRIFLYSGVKLIDQPKEGLLRANCLVYESDRVYYIHSAIIQPSMRG